MDDQQKSSRTQPPKAVHAYDKLNQSRPAITPSQQRQSASSLLRLFKAEASPSSVSQMHRAQRASKPVTYIELDDSDDDVQFLKSVPTPQSQEFVPSEASQDESGSM